MAHPILQEGDPAPAFEAKLDDGSEVSSRDLAGKRTVLYFYPKDNTPGCTIEACDFRDNLARLKEVLGIQVIGVSPDSVASHQKFKARHELGFPLISDPDRALATAYGVWQQKKMYGRSTMGIVRSTFVIGPDGTIEKAYYNVKAKGHVDRLLEDLS